MTRPEIGPTSALGSSKARIRFEKRSKPPKRSRMPKMVSMAQRMLGGKARVPISALE